VKQTTGFYPRPIVDTTASPAAGQAGGVLLTETIAATGLGRELATALKPSRDRIGPMTQQSGWHDNPQDRSRLRCRDAVIWSSDVTPKVSPTVDRADIGMPCGVTPAGPGAAGRPVAGIRRRP
jgi:hypothetical protein